MALRELLSTVPHVAYAAAYGSAVVRQAGYAGSGMVDYILAVHDPAAWHRENIERNGAAHYSILRMLGAQAIARIQDTGAGVYFNVPDLRGQCTGLDKAKYAVIQHSSLCDELEDWKNLYLSGRLQKPVVTLVDCPRLQEARHKNCDMACATALLLLPERFDETELYATISAISYTGDPRMSFGEHPDKALQIAASQTDNFRLLYTPSLTKLSQHVSADTPADAKSGPHLLSAQNRTFIQDTSPLSQARLLLSLPSALLSHVGHHAKIDDLIHHAPSSVPSSSSMLATADRDERAHRLAERLERCRGLVADSLPAGIAALVRPAARVQMVKGFLSFGVSTSVEYIRHKLSRALAPRMGK